MQLSRLYVQKSFQGRLDLTAARDVVLYDSLRVADRIRPWESRISAMSKSMLDVQNAEADAEKQLSLRCVQNLLSCIYTSGERGMSLVGA